MEIICLFMGILFYYTHHIYLPIILLALIYVSRKYIKIVVFIFGILIGLSHQWFIATQGMPDSEVIPHALIEGSIVSVPVQSPYKTQFTLALTKLNDQPVQGLVQLAWYQHPPSLHAGQVWQLQTKLKKPRNFQNPGGFDYVQALETRHITWTGYILNHHAKLIQENPPGFSWLHLRETWGKRLTQLAPDTATAGVVEALTLNLTHHISQEQWGLFQRTGTIHLFGISGEHVALISGMMFLLIKWLWSRNARLCLWIPAVRIAGLGAFLTALLYAFIAGFAPPVQRALIGCFFYSIRCLGLQRVTAWQTWRYALLAILLMEPHVVFMQGFYFSFLAVACLLITQQRFKFTGFKASLVLQASCLIGLLPLTLYWYSYGSINGFVANLIAIPLVGFLIVPLALITMITSSYNMASLLMIPLSWLIGLLMKILVWTELIAWININHSIHSVAIVLALMTGLFILSLMPLSSLKWLALLCCFIPVLPKRPLLSEGEALVQVLDVGQGLAVSIQTQHHTLLYDTGDAFYQGSDLGTMVILPFYNYLGIKALDAIVISHPDKDHIGGLKSIQQGMAVQKLIMNKPSKDAFSCHHYPDWTWDGVHFHFFSILTTFPGKNNNSCILQVKTRTGAILLTGDIEKIAEDYLVKTYNQALKSEVLLVAHHASKTSSSYRFLLEVSPQYAIASLGFDNRFHFPHAQTLQTLKSLNINLDSTDKRGMIEVLFSNNRVVING